MAEEGGTGAKPARGTRGPRVVRRRVRSPRPTGGWDFLVASRSDAPPWRELVRRPPCGMGADTPVGSAEPGLDECFALVAELECEEVAALVEGAKEEFVPFPQLLRQELALRKPHELAFVAVGERARELRAGEEVHVFDAHAMNCPYSSLQNDLEHEIAALPSLGDGHTLRFSVLLIPHRIKIAYGPVHVKAYSILFLYHLVM